MQAIKRNSLTLLPNLRIITLSCNPSPSSHPIPSQKTNRFKIKFKFLKLL